MADWQETAELGLIPADWRYCTVQDLVDSKAIEKPMDGNHGSIHPKGDDFVEAGIPFVMASDIADGQIDLVHCKFISEDQANSLQKGHSVAGDVLLTHKATLGRTAVVPDLDTPFIMLTPQVTYYRVTEKPDVDRYFLKYFFDSPRFQDCLISHGDAGSTRSYIGITAQRLLPVCLPDPKEQKVIAEILSSLDDKIELLYRQNGTLEALAETLFRQTFIEEAQDDWGEEPLDQVANYLNGLACQKYPATNPVERLPVLKIKDLKNGLSDSSDWATSKVPPEYIVENGDIIFSWSASLLVKVWDGPKCVLNQHLFKVTSDRFPDWVIYQWTKHHLDRFIAIAETKATTMGHIKRTDLAAAIVKVPDQQSLVEAEETFAPLHQKIIANNRQIATLTELRDELLPKLMSGEVRVRFEAADA